MKVGPLYDGFVTYIRLRTPLFDTFDGNVVGARIVYLAFPFNSKPYWKC